MKKGFTLIELMIVIAICGIFASIVAPFILSRSKGNNPTMQGSPTQAAYSWAKAMGFYEARVTCTDYDTDNDGYVSCSVGAKQANGSIEIIPIECASHFSLNNGCRVPKAVLRQ